MSTVNPTQDVANRDIAQIIYGLHAAVFITAITGVIAVIVNYVKRDEVAGTWLESHFTWQVRTFWAWLFGIVSGWIFFFTVIGIPLALVIWGVTLVWYIYRIAKGWLRLIEGKAMYT